MPPGVKHQTCLVREFGIAVRALVSFLLVVHGVVIVEIGPGFERGTAHVTDERPVLRMDQRVALQQLLVFESFVADPADVGTTLAVRHLLPMQNEYSIQIFTGENPPLCDI